MDGYYFVENILQLRSWHEQRVRYCLSQAGLSGLLFFGHVISNMGILFPHFFVVLQISFATCVLIWQRVS